MIFPITDLLDDKQSEKWLLEHFHPEGLRCPKCDSTRRRFFRETQTSRLTVYRCLECEGIYNLYFRYALREETLAPLAGGFALARGSQRGIELEVGPGAWRRKPLHGARAAQRELQENARRLQPEAPLRDAHIETDEMFQNAGEKGERHLDPEDPPRRRANKRRGHGSYYNDRPPIIGTVGRRTGE